jgi:hypothetical protein
LKVRVSVDIDAPPAVVWAQLERIEDHVSWMRDAERIRFTSRRRRGVGTAFVCDTRIGPLRLADALEISQWRPERSMAVAHRGVVQGDGRFVLSSRRRGRTHLRWTERLTFPWWLGGPIAGWLARPALRWVWKRNLRAFKALVEQR